MGPLGRESHCGEPKGLRQRANYRPLKHHAMQKTAISFSPCFFSIFMPVMKILGLGLSFSFASSCSSLSQGGV